jgi:imidazolonepropionase-like amidohydrolase
MVQFRRLLVSCLFLITATLAQPPGLRAQGLPLVIRGGHYFDVQGGRMVPNHGITVLNGKIMSIATAPGAAVPKEARLVELEADEYLLPGLIDVHAHYNVDLDGTGRRDETVVNPVVFLANGVTATFPGGEYDPDRMLEARRRIDRGEQIGPRILSSGPYFGTARPGWNRAMTAQQIYDEVDFWAAQGVSGFKAKGISPEHLRPLIERAHQHGLTVTGHLESGFRNTVNAMDAIAMGIDRVEHIMGGRQLSPDSAAYPLWNRVDVASPQFKEIVALFLEHRIYFDPTITAPVYLSDWRTNEGFDYWVDERKFFTPEVQEQVRQRGPRRASQLMDQLHLAMLRTTKAFYDAGGGDLLTLGTDNPSRGEFLPGFSAHRELHALVRAGIPPAAALRIGTINGARALKVSDRIGSIETGKFADLFVVSGNPLQEIRNTRNVKWVMKGGQIHDPAALLRSVEGRLGPPPARVAAQ